MAETDPTHDRRADEPTDENSSETPATSRYATLSLGGGEAFLYDRQNPRAWLRSDDGVSPATME